MNDGPDPRLMQLYGTKTAASLGSLRAPLQMMAAMQMVHGQGGRLAGLRAQAEQLNEQARVMEMRRMGGVAGNFSNAQAPVFLSAGSGIGPFGYPVPVGMDKGMVRLASAERSGRVLAHKVAGLGLKQRASNAALKAVTAGGLAVGAGGVIAGKGMGLAQQHVLDDMDTSTAGKLVPIKKFAGIGPAAGQIGGAAMELGKKALSWGRKGMSKTTLRGTLAGGAVAAGALGVTGAGKKAIDVMSTEAKPYVYGASAFRPATGVSRYGYATPAAPRY